MTASMPTTRGRRLGRRGRKRRRYLATGEQNTKKQKKKHTPKDGRRGRKAHGEASSPDPLSRPLPFLLAFRALALLPRCSRSFLCLPERTKWELSRVCAPGLGSRDAAVCLEGGVETRKREKENPAGAPDDQMTKERPPRRRDTLFDPPL